MELVADLAGAAAMADQLEYLEFSVGQLRYSVLAFAAKRNALENARGDPPRKINFAAQNSANARIRPAAQAQGDAPPADANQ